MPSNVRVVLDTSVLISAALHGVQADYVLDVIAEGRMIGFTSQSILDEVNDRLANKFHWRAEQVEVFQKTLLKVHELVLPVSVTHAQLRDPGDLHVLGTAVAAKANLIITLDRDLLTLRRYKAIGIIHPKTLFWTFPDSTV